MNMAQADQAEFDGKKGTIGLVLFLAAVALHRQFFPMVIPRDTRAFSGRNLFVYGHFTFGDVIHQLLVHMYQLFLIQGLPMLLLFLAYRAVRGKGRPGSYQIPTEYAVLFVLAAFLLPAGYEMAAEKMHQSGDEFCYIFQSRIFRDGQFSLVNPGFLDFLLTSVMMKTSPWCQLLPPGWSAFLALFPKSLIWMGPVAACGLSAIALFFLGRALLGSPAACWALALVCLSPGFFWEGGLYFPHHALLAALAGGSYLYIMAQKKESVFLACLAGLVLAWGFNTRPVETAVFAVSTVVWFLLYRKQVKIQPAPFVVLGISGLLGCLVCWSYARRVGGLYPFVDPNPPHHFVAALWNGFYIFYRQITWWSPFILTLVALRIKRGGLKKEEAFLLLNALFSYLAFASFIDNGQIEFGARYLVFAWSFLGLVAGVELHRLASSLKAGVAVSLIGVLVLYNLVTLPDLYAETRHVLQWFILSLRRDYPPNSDFYIRSTPQLNPEWFSMTFPGPNEPHFYAFLEPEHTRAFRLQHPDRRAYVVDWQGDHYTVVPFEETNIFDGWSRMSAANFIARVMMQRDRGIEEWKTIPPTDPFYAAARLNIAMVYFETKDREKGLAAFKEAEALGIPQERLQPIREKYHIP